MSSTHPARGARARILTRSAPLWAGAGVVLVAPFFAAFRAGGYYPTTQLIVGIAAFAVLAVVAVVAPWPPLPGGLPLAALAALLGLGVWTGLSTGWARILEPAVHDTHRLAAYVAYFALALAVLRDRRARRIVPDVLLAGIAVVCLYSLAGRFLPHIVHERANSARLSQPLTYWNALGIFAGFGFLLGVATAGDRARAMAVRSAACAAAIVCGLTAYLTLSRGVAAAGIAGLVLCVLLRRGRATLVSAACAAVPVVVLALLANDFRAVLSSHADTSKQASQGALFMAVALAAIGIAVLAHRRLTRSRLARGALPLAPRLRRAAAVAVVPLVLAVAVGIAAHGKERTRVPQSAERITSIETARGHYWRVAFAAFRHHPVAGIGSGSFTAEWRLKRGHDQPALDAHSLYLETLAELGIVGGLLVLALVGTITAGVVRAVRVAPRDPLVAAAAAVLGAFAVHLALDWDWEMPAVSLIPLALAAAVLQRQAGASVS